MTSWGSYSYAFGPLVALGGVLVAMWLLRRAFRREQPTIPDEEVLAPLLGPHTWAEVNRVAVRLDRAGIRHRVVDLRTSYQLQVPADDLAAARTVLHSAD